MSSPSELASELADVTRRLADLERANRLANASLDATGIPVYDEDGNVRQVVGRQDDGTYTVTDTGAPPPVTPSAPTVTPGLGSLVVTWDGKTADGSTWRKDFARVEVHVSATAGFTPTDATHVSSFIGTKGGTLAVSDVDPGTTYYVQLVAANTSGAESPGTVEVSGVPSAAMSDAELQQIADDVETAQTAADAAADAAAQAVQDASDAVSAAAQASQDAADASAEVDGKVPTSAAYTTSNTGAADSDDWTKFATVTIDARYATADFDLALAGTGPGAPPEQQSESIGYVSTIGTAEDAASGDTLTVPVTQDVPVGNTVMVSLAHVYTSGGPSVADSRGNIYRRDRTAANSGGTLRTSVFSAPVATELLAGDTITITLSAAVTAKAATIVEFAGLAEVSMVDAYNSGQAAGSTTGTAGDLTTTDAYDLAVAAIGSLNPVTDGFTEGAGFTSDARDGTNEVASQAGPNLTVNSAHRIVTSTGSYDYEPTFGTATDSVGIQVGYKGASAAPGGGGGGGGSYDAAVLADNPVGYWPLADGSNLADSSKPAAFPAGTPSATVLPSGEPAVVFDGASEYAEIADDDAYSVTSTGQLTIEAWIRPDVVNFPHTEYSSDGDIVYPLVKGENYGSSGDQEYVLRMYNQASSRPNRISGYLFNPDGGLGAGSYVQETITPGEWMHIAVVFDTVNLGGDGWGTVRIYKDGVLKDTDSLGDPYYITPENKGAPIHLGARPGHSFFQGAMGKVAVYDQALSSTQIAAHTDAMSVAVPQGTTPYDTAVLADSPVGYWTGLAGTNMVDASKPAVTVGSPSAATLPSGEEAIAFDGATQYAEIADDDAYSVTTTGQLTYETWIRPDTLNFSNTESSSEGDIVYPLVRGTRYQSTGNQEYCLRMYNQASERPNRLSGYLFSASGGEGAGSYVQETVTPGEWIHIAVVFDTVNLGADGWGTVSLYKNGVLKDTDSLGDPYYVIPENGDAPIHLGARPGHSWFEGAIGKTAVYGQALTGSQIAAHYDAMTAPSGGGGGTGTADISYVGTIGTVEDSTPGDTLTVPVTQTVPAGHTVVVNLAHEWTSGGPSVTDSGGNSYTRDRTAANSGSTLRSSVFSAPVTTELTAGDTITITLSASVDLKAATVVEFAGIAEAGRMDTYNSGQAAGSTTGTAGTLNTSNAYDLIVAMVGSLNPVSDGFTEAPGYTTDARDGTNEVVQPTNVTLAAAHRILTSTGTYQYEPTFDSPTDSVAVQVAYKGATVEPADTGSSGGSDARWALLHFRVKQDNPLGEDPFLTAHYTAGSFIQPEHFRGIVTQSTTGQVVVEWWVQVAAAWEAYGFTPSQQATSGSCTVEFHEQQPFVLEADLPAGAQTVGVDKSHNPTTGQVSDWTYPGTVNIDGGLVYAETIAAEQIAANAIIAGKIAAGAVEAGTIAADAVTANEIAAGAVTTGHLAALAVTAGKIAANAVTADKLEAVLVLANRLIAGVPDGERAELAADGLKSYDASGKETFSATGGSVFLSGVVESYDYVEAETGWRLGAEGAQIANLNALEEIGAEVTSTQSLLIDGDDLMTDIIPARSGGAVAYGHAESPANSLWITSGTNSGNGFVIGLFNAGELDNERIYAIHWRLTCNPDRAMSITTRLTYTTDGSYPGAAGAVLPGSHANAHASSAEWVTLNGFAIIDSGGGTGTTPFRFGLAVLTSDAGQFQVRTAAIHKPSIYLVDLGPRADAPRTLSLQNLSDGTTEPDPVQTYKKTWFTTWGRPFNGDGSVWKNGGNEPNDLYQGRYDATHGNTKSMIGFDDADIRSKLSGATIKKVQLTFRVKHAYYGTGLDVRIGTHNDSGQPVNFHQTQAEVAQKNGVNAGSTVTVTLPNSVGNDFKNGNIRGITFGPGESNDKHWYGYLYGNQSGNGPKLTITYER